MGVIVFKLCMGIVVIIIFTPLAVVFSLPLILIHSLIIDRDNYWESVAHKIKTVFRTVAEIAGIVGSSM